MLVLLPASGPRRRTGPADLGAWSTILRVWQQKILLVHHIRSLEETSLANMMYKEQVKNKYLGLAKEAEQLCEKLAYKPKTVYTAEVKKACKRMEDIMMKTETSDMEKMRIIRAEEWGLKDYVQNGSLWSVRKTWEARAFTLHVADNYSHNNKYQATGWR